MKRFHWPDQRTLRTYDNNHFYQPKPRPPCTHGRDRKPVKFELADNTNVWGGPPPTAKWNLNETIVLSLLEYHTKYHDVHYPIYNFETPKEDCATFDILIAELTERAIAGARIYVHCFGGHGRTGLVFGCMAATMGIDNPVQYVRNNYCQRAIENTLQETFVNEYNL